MCGIAGFFHTKQDLLEKKEYFTSVLDTMRKSLKHRGDDEHGIYLSTHCGLAHARLSIIDLTTGSQPMLRKENGNTCAIIHNGEIYNMKELKEELAKKDVAFSTTSDTEVILAGYMAEGISFVEKLNGIFATAIYDEAKKTLYLFRDRLGVKPLFFMQLDDTLLFASELKGLFAYPGNSPAIDKDSLCEIFGLGPAKTYGKGIFKNTKEVLPGTILTVSLDGIKEHAYWRLTSVPHEEDFEETIEKTAYLIKDAVKKQMLSDVPICTFLSGGVDSSLVTSICARELKEKGIPLSTYSFDFKDNSIHFKSNSFQPSEDRPFVEKMVKHCKTEHTYLECDNDDLIEGLYEAVDARDLPCMADVESSLLYFCKQVVKNHKVALTGECADEIFGGYPWFHKKECFEADCFPWTMDMTPRKLLLKDDVISTLPLEAYARNAYEMTISETPLLSGETPTEKRRREIAYLNLKWFMATLLDRMDRTSMACGLEARVPFADHRIVEYVWNVPWEMKCPNGLVKGLLRYAATGYLPDAILYRKKSPYPKTYNPEYEALLGNLLMEVLEDTSSPLNDYVDKKKAAAFLKSPSDYGKPFYGQLMAGPQLLAYLLQVNYWLKKYNL